MKKIITIVSILFIVASVNSQNKKNKRTAANKCYLEAAATTFELSEEKKEKLNTLLLKKLKDKASIRKMAKSSEITKDEVKSKSKAMNQKYFKNVASLTGKSKKEVMIFEKGVRSKCR